MAQVGQGSLDSPVAPSPILGGHTHHQLLDLVLPTRTAWDTLLAAIVLLGDQPAVPSHERCRGHNRGQLMQHAPAQLLGPHGQAPALIVVEAQPLASELFAENVVLLLEIVDDILLLLV